MDTDKLNNIKYFNQNDAANILSEFLQDTDKVYSVKTSKRSVELPEESTLIDKVVDAPYLHVVIRPEFIDEVKNVINNNLEDNIEIKQLDNTDIECHFTYNLEGGISYAPLIEQDINY